MIKTYAVHFPITIEVVKRVRATSAEQAEEIVRDLFRGLSLEWNGNSAFCDGEGEEIVDSGWDQVEEILEVEELEEGDSGYDDYDTDSEDYIDEEDEEDDE